MNPSTPQELRTGSEAASKPAGAASVASSAGALGPGGRLGRMRQQKGIPLDDVVGFLKYGARQIEALEADDYEALPPAAVVRGMLRSYARFLGTDPQPLLDELRQLLDGSPPEVTAHLMDVHFRARRGLSRSVWWIVPVVIVVVVVAAAAVDFFISKRDSALGRLRPSEPPRAAAGSPGAAPGEGRSAPPVASAAGSPGSAGNAAGSSEGARAGSGTVSSVESAGTKPAPVLTRRIAMHFTSPCWVEVRAGDGQVLVSEVLDAGTDKVIEGKPPFRVTLGAAHGVTLTYDGEPINLSPHTVVDVAHLSLN